MQSNSLMILAEAAAEFDSVPQCVQNLIMFRTYVEDYESISVNDQIFAGVFALARDLEIPKPPMSLSTMVDYGAGPREDALYSGVRCEFPHLVTQKPVIANMWIVTSERGVRTHVPRLSFKVAGVELKDSGDRLTKLFTAKLNFLVCDAGLDRVSVKTSDETSNLVPNSVRVRARWHRVTDRTVDCAMALTRLFLEFITNA